MSVSTTNNYADLLTKSQTSVRFEQLLNMINPKQLRKVVHEKPMLVFRSLVQAKEEGCTRGGGQERTSMHPPILI